MVPMQVVLNMPRVACTNTASSRGPGEISGARCCIFLEYFHNFGSLILLGVDSMCQEILFLSLCYVSFQAWVGHPYYDVIDNSTDFNQKCMRMMAVSINVNHGV